MNCCNSQLNDGPIRVADYASDVQPTWCGGCGNYGIWAAAKRALVELQIAPHEVLLCFDIGCNGNMSDKICGYRFHSLHGRVLPVAAAAKLANPKVKVIAFAGDGATYSEGINHFINTFRNNYPITLFVHDNGNYALTKGQASATTPQEAYRTASPDGPTSTTLNALDLALSLQPSFLARGFSGDIKELTEIMKSAISWQDKGFAFVNILQACPTFNHETTHNWYLDRVKRIEEIDPQFNPQDLVQAKKYITELDEHIATGVLYQNDQQPSYLDRLTYRGKGSSWGNSTLVDEVKNYDTANYFAQFR